jgi:predicted DNA-binding ArsR family transcriptional regulator
VLESGNGEKRKEGESSSAWMCLAHMNQGVGEKGNRDSRRLDQVHLLFTSHLNSTELN